MLEKFLKQLDDAIITHALDSIDRPYDPGVIEFQAGRRSGISAGLRLARKMIIDSLKEKADDEAGNPAKAVRRASGSLS